MVINKMKNSTSRSSNTGYKGIYYRQTTNKYETQISINKKSGGFEKVHIGNFDTLIQAKKARVEYIKNLL